MNINSSINGSEEIISEENVGEKCYLIGHYMTGDIIGEGSFAIVKDAINVETLIRVAVKVFKMKEIKKIPNGLNSVDKEINLLRKLRHKNILYFYESIYSEDNLKICLIYELCATCIQRMLDDAGKLPKFQAQNYFKQTLEGISYLHSRGVVHLDIKPANLMLKFDKTLKIGDFGVAQQVETLQDGTFVHINSGGSPAFQPPEVLSHDHVVDPFKIDIWSLGVTLYSMVLGEHPFMGENIFIIYNNITDNSYEIPYSVEKEDVVFLNLLKIMLERDPLLRATPQQVARSKWATAKLPTLEMEIPFPPYCHSNPYFDTTTAGKLEEMYITKTMDVEQVRKAKRAKKVNSTCLAQ